MLIIKKVLIGRVRMVLINAVLPATVRSLGVHLVCEDVITYSPSGNRAFLIASSSAVLNAPGEITRRPTGVIAAHCSVDLGF